MNFYDFFGGGGGGGCTCVSQLYMIGLRRLCSNILVLELWISVAIIHLTCLLLCLIPPGYAQMPICLDACVPVITCYRSPQDFQYHAGTKIATSQ